MHRIKLITCDVRDYFSVEKVIKQVVPDYIFHLAAQSFVQTSWAMPNETLQTNILGTLNIFEALRSLRIDAGILVACSSEEYGLVFEHELPIKETNALRPLSPYAVSKVAQDLLGWQYFCNYKLRIFRTRAFNHTGPRRGDVFATSNFAKQIAMIEKNLQKPVIYVGNLETQRDFTDVRDMVRAYVMCVEKGRPGEIYNICSGRAWRMKEVLDLLLQMTKVNVTIEQDIERMRPSDVPILLGDNTKFCEQTGWAPHIPLEQTLQDLLNYWRERITNSGKEE